jgi:hypothetical protein
VKVKISEMLAYYEPHAIVTDGKTTNPPPKHQDGYVMGGDGRIATDGYIKSRAKSSYPLQWEAYYEAYKKWLGHCVIDCNAVAEAFYKSITHESIDTKAKYNYSGWCSPKSPSTPDKLLAGLPQIPGVAVFSAPEDTDNPGNITHVGYLLRKYGEGPLDWYVLEARGKDYGLVITKLTSREWRWWGVMSKYFEHDGDLREDKEEKKEEPIVPKIVTKSNTYGEEALKLQQMLNAYGYTSADGKPLVEDGKFGTKSMEAFDAFRKAHGFENTVEVEVPAPLPDALKLTLSLGGKQYGLDIKEIK